MRKLAFSRQTGLSCNVCHSNAPEQTAFGRDFKLKAYVLSDMTDLTKVGYSKGLLLSRYIPLSGEILLSSTTFQLNQPKGSQNNTVGFPQQLSLIFAGGFAPHFGDLAHVSYTHVDDHFALDDVDLRYASKGQLAGKDWLYGILLNNTPTTEDVWNSTPSWGFPWISSNTTVGQVASSLIENLVGDVAGLGTYSMWHRHLYTCFTAYRSEHAGGSAPIAGVGYPYNITTGNADPALYPSAPVSGSFNGSPNTSGYKVQFAYWPVQNIDLNLNYTGYTKFNGAKTNYDGAGRSASDNNTLYLSLLVTF